MPNALITGASRGLGLAVAKALAERGWNLVITARGESGLEKARAELTQKTQVTAIPGDISEAAHARALVKAARELGGLDALINNASVLGPSSDAIERDWKPQPALVDYPLDVLERVYRVNVFAPLQLIQLALPILKPGARVINVTSDAGLEAYEGWGGYGSSKAALEHVSKILALEQPALRVYWVDPGDMNTRMHQEAFPGEDISDRPAPDASVPGFLQLLEGDLPSGRYQTQKMEGTS